MANGGQPVGSGRDGRWSEYRCCHSIQDRLENKQVRGISIRQTNCETQDGGAEPRARPDSLQVQRNFPIPIPQKFRGKLSLKNKKKKKRKRSSVSEEVFTLKQKPVLPSCAAPTVSDRPHVVNGGNGWRGSPTGDGTQEASRRGRDVTVAVASVQTRSNNFFPHGDASAKKNI